MSSTFEIERKYFVAQIPECAAGCAQEEIEQGYITADAQEEVRLRKQGGARFWLTVKRGSGLARGTLEVELSADQFNKLWPAAAGRRLRKMRTALPLGEVVVEIDQYLDGLSGLCVAEVEFPTVEASRSFVPPSWFGPELTDDSRFANKNLALHGLADDSGRNTR